MTLRVKLRTNICKLTLFTLDEYLFKRDYSCFIYRTMLSLDLDLFESLGNCIWILIDNAYNVITTELQLKVSSRSQKGEIKQLKSNYYMSTFITQT
jgi:hypothetical protein